MKVKLLNCKLMSTIKLLLKKMLVKILLIIIVVFASVNLILRFLPYIKLDEFLDRDYSTRVYDNNNNLLQITSLENGLRREFISIDKVEKKVINAFIDAEDKRFYFHCGIDFISIVRAICQNKKAQKNVSGASTITMQLAKIINQNFYNRSITTKIQEALCALKIEARFSKKQILEMYLNALPFGNNVEGILSASRLYFSKEINDLSQQEIELLSKIPRRPNFYSLKKTFEYPFYCPHLIRFLQERKFYSKNKKNTEVHLSIDLKLQKYCEQLASMTCENVKDNRIKNISILVLDVKNAKVLSWVGSQNFFDKENAGQIDGVIAKNQPGSAIKPFLYALALQKNIVMPNAVLPDIRFEFGQGKVYIPDNFNNSFNGPVSLRTCLASSLNIPAVYLLSKIGIENFANSLNELGFDSVLEQSEYMQSSLALGGAQVSLKEILGAFCVFARDGKFMQIDFFKDDVFQKKVKQVFDKNVARIIDSFLLEKNARSLGFGLNQSFQTLYPSIFKTGTSNQFQSIIALSATPRYAVGVWMGNFSGETVMGKTGSSIPARVAKNILDYLEKNDNLESEDFLQPENYVLEKVCSLSGMRPTHKCPYTVYEFLKKDYVNQKCSWHKNSNDIYYPEIYVKYLQENPNLKNIKIDYKNGPLEIITPKNYSIYYKEKNLLNSKFLDMQVLGGTHNELEIFVDEKFYKKIYKPFITKIPLVKGKHCLKIVCGNQENIVFYEVR